MQIKKIVKKLLPHRLILIFVRAYFLFFRIIRPKFFYFLFQHKKPISDRYGADRGTPIDRYYIDQFLDANRKFIRGHCLEIENNLYAKKYGSDNIEKVDVLYINFYNQRATIHGDLRKLDNIYDNTYDCIILTQVFHFIDDFESALRECKRILKPSGALLATLPTIGRIDIAAGIENDFWRFTAASAKYIFGKLFPIRNLEIQSKGNALVGMSFWVGLSQEDLSRKNLDYIDLNFPCLITVRAIKQ